MFEDPADFGTFGRYVETPVEEMPPDMRSAYEYTRQLRGMVPGPHKDPAGQSRAAEGDCADRILLPDGLVAVEGGRRDRHGPLAAACANESTRRSLSR